MNTTNNNRSLVLLPNIWEILNMVANEKSKDEAFDLLTILVNYMTKDEEPPQNLPLEIRLFFKTIQPLLDSMKAKYDSSVTNGKKGGRPPKAKPMADKPKEVVQTASTDTESEVQVMVHPNKENEYFARLEKVGFLQEMANHFQVTANLVKSFFDRFQKECTYKGKIHESFEDCQGHFYNWLARQNINDVGTGANNINDRQKRDLVWAEYARQRLSANPNETDTLPQVLQDM